MNLIYRGIAHLKAKAKPFKSVDIIYRGVAGKTTKPTKTNTKGMTLVYRGVTYISK